MATGGQRCRSSSVRLHIRGVDLDRDGLADLYVLVYGPPDRGPNIQADNAPPNHLFHNNGDGTFTDVSKRSRADAST